MQAMLVAADCRVHCRLTVLSVCSTYGSPSAWLYSVVQCNCVYLVLSVIVWEFRTGSCYLLYYGAIHGFQTWRNLATFSVRKTWAVQNVNCATLWGKPWEDLPKVCMRNSEECMTCLSWNGKRICCPYHWCPFESAFSVAGVLCPKLYSRMDNRSLGSLLLSSYVYIINTNKCVLTTDITLAPYIDLPHGYRLPDDVGLLCLYVTVLLTLW